MALPQPERRCTAPAKRGGQCPGWRLKSGGTFCAFHDPKRVAQLKGGQANGVRARQEHRPATAIEVERAKIKLAAIADIPAAIELIANDVVTGRLSDKEGSTLARLASAAVQAHVAIDELAERAHKRRIGLTDDQIREALERIRGQQKPQREAMS